MSDSKLNGQRSSGRALALLEAVVLDGGKTPISQLFADAEISPATGRRLTGLLVAQGYLMRISRGRYAGSEKLRHLAACVSPHARLIEIARPILRRMAQAERATAYLGVFEGEMVTYLVKEGAQTGFTREQGQLEAYCTGIGKILLGHLSESRLDAYLAAPLVSLTGQTITDPDALRAELRTTRTRGYAIDDREMAEDLGCIAVGLEGVRGSDYAISVSGSPRSINRATAAILAARLKDAANEIRDALGR